MDILKVIMTLIPTTKTRFEKRKGSYVCIVETIWCGQVIRTTAVPVKELIK
jgi:hypothetical protein